MPILVQVKKDKVETKGVRISTDINIPGKYVAVIPNADFVTVSNKIEDTVEIERLKKIASDNVCDNYGVVVRTAACGKAREEIASEIAKMKKIYKNIMEKYEQLKSNNKYPAKIYETGGVVNKMLLAYADGIDSISLNNKALYNLIKSQYVEVENKIKWIDSDNIFSDSIIRQIEKLESRKIWLNCGGFITIDKTEALTAIDVNTGKYTGNNSLEQTVFKVNEEATVEIAKQLRARDIGGIIIVDYIDMEEKESERKIIELLRKCLKQDRAKTQVIGFTPLHLLEMTRKHLYSS